MTGLAPSGPRHPAKHPGTEAHGASAHRLGVRSRRVRLAVLAVGWAVLAGWASVQAAGRVPDDIFITFRYAWNLAHGEGFVFNPGERVFGLTNPGLGLLLGLLHELTRVPVHHLGVGVFAAGLWALALLLLRGEARVGRTWRGVLAGTLVITSSAIWKSAGAAAPSVLALLAASALVADRRPVLAGTLAGLAAWFRPDAVLGIAALGALLWGTERRFPLAWAAATAGTLLAGVGAAWLWFGTPLPQTLLAKRAFLDALELARGPREGFWEGAGAQPRFHLGRLWLPVLAAGILGQWPLFARGGLAVRTVGLYAAGVALTYPLLRVPFHAWYAIPVVVALLYGMVAFGLETGRAAGRFALGPGASHRRLRLAAGACAVVLLAPIATSVTRASAGWFARTGPIPRFGTYREAGLWIRRNSLPEHRVAFYEIGNVAYWSRRPVDDLLGLVTPPTVPYSRVADREGALLLLAPDFFLVRFRGRPRGLAAKPWFRRSYYPVARFDQRKGPHALLVYRKRPDAELPRTRPPRPPGWLAREP